MYIHVVQGSVHVHVHVGSTRQCTCTYMCCLLWLDEVEEKPPSAKKAKKEKKKKVKIEEPEVLYMWRYN